MTAHATFGPSKAKVYLNCTAAYAVGGLESEASSYASEGTTAHDLLELAMISYRDGGGTLVDTPTGSMPVAVAMQAGRFTGDMYDAVAVTRDYVKEIINELTIAGVPYVLFIEVRVDISPWTTDGQFGTADLILATPRKLWVIDFKYGKGVEVEAEENDQLSLYGLGAMEYVSFGFPDIEEVTLAISQPRLRREVSEWTTTAEQLRQWGGWARTQVQHNLDPQLRTFVVGDHCSDGFCALRRTCRARAEHYQQIAEAKAKAELSLDEIATLLPHLSGMVKWANGLEEKAETLALSGTKVPGYKLVAGRANRYITDEQAAAKRLSDNGYAEDRYLKPAKLVGLTELEKLVGGKKAFAAILGEPGEDGSLVAKAKPKPTLVPESDKRSEWVLDGSADDDFADAPVCGADADFN